MMKKQLGRIQLLEQIKSVNKLTDEMMLLKNHAELCKQQYSILERKVIFLFYSTLVRFR